MANKPAQDGRDDDAVVSPPVAQSQGNGCLFCVRDTNVALAKDLITRMIRGGMGFDAATELARDVVGAMASK